jgi:hypothetical protein
MSCSANEPEVFGFSRSDWVRSGAFTEEHFDRIVGGIELGEQIAFTVTAWLALARLGPDYATTVWARFGDSWVDRLRRLRLNAAEYPPSLGGSEAFDRAGRHLASNIRMLRRLADLPDLDLLA